LKAILRSVTTAIIWFIIVTILLCIPGSKFPKRNWLDDIWFDKWVHIGIFGLLVILWCRVIAIKYPLDKKNKTRFLWISLAALVYGIVMEFVQEYVVTNRSFDILDILADGIGCMIGLFICVWIYKKKTPVETGVVNQN